MNILLKGASHVLSIIHEILAHHRQLEAKWHQKKIKLHQRLALRLFQEDVKQVTLVSNLREQRIKIPLVKEAVVWAFICSIFL